MTASGRKSAVAVLLFLLLLSSPSLAHLGVDDSRGLDDGYTRTLHMVSWVSLFAAPAGAGLLLARRFRARGRVEPLYGTLATLAVLWVALAVVPPRTFFPFHLAQALGIAVVLLFLLSAWAILLREGRSVLSGTVRRGVPRIVMITVSISFGVFFAFATNMVQVANPDALGAGPPPEEGFVRIYQSFGPLAMWPDVEFWIPALQLNGFLSLGPVLVLLTLSVFMGLAMALLVASMKRARREKLAMGGSAGAALATNVCSCCTPLVYAALVPLLGATAAASVAYAMSDPDYALYNLSMVGNVLLLLYAIRSSLARLRLSVLQDAGTESGSREPVAGGVG